MEVFIIICSSLFVISTVLLGIGELAFKNANSFFDVISEKKARPITEQVILARFQDKKIEVNSVTQRWEEIPKRDEEEQETDEKEEGEEERSEEIGNVDERHQKQLDAARQQRIVEAIDAFGKRLSTDSHD